MCSVCWFSFMPSYSLRLIFPLSQHTFTFELLGQGITIYLNLLYYFIILGLFHRTFFWHMELHFIWKYFSKSWINVFLSETLAKRGMQVHTCCKGIQLMQSSAIFMCLSRRRKRKEMEPECEKWQICLLLVT